MKIKVAYIISNINKAISFEWIVSYLDKSRFDLVFVLINSSDSSIETYLKENDVKYYSIAYNRKIDFIKAVFICSKILYKEKPDVIHCHLFNACLIGLISGKIIGIKKRVYTRHHSNLHHTYFPKGVYYDKLINFLATEIIAISGVVKEILTSWEGVNEEKVMIINHGFVLKDFVNYEEIKISKLIRKYNPDNRRPVIGVISRYVEWKGIQYIIPAFKKVLLKYPDALLILANANGSFCIEKLLEELPENTYIQIKFEEDIVSLYNLFDIFVHVPIDPYVEAFGQIYIEALAVGIPSVFTLSGIALEFVIDKENAMVVDYKNSDQICESINLILNDSYLTQKLIKNGRSAISKFEISKMINQLEEYYEKK